jgi:hypothetical protein
MVERTPPKFTVVSKRFVRSTIDRAKSSDDVRKAISDLPPRAWRRWTLCQECSQRPAKCTEVTRGCAEVFFATSS